MISPLPSYLSLRYESEIEENYISGLVYQYEMARDTGSYHLALFAYHLLFMSYAYQTIHKIKKWMPDRFYDALIQSPADKRKEYFEANSPWIFAKIPERSIFEFFNLLQTCGMEVKKCKNAVDFRNDGFGHATGILISEDEFERRIEEYDEMAGKIHGLTQKELCKIFEEYISSIESDDEITKDELELNLILPNRLSDHDLERLAVECLIKTTPRKNKISKIIQEDFKIFVEIIENKLK